MAIGATCIWEIRTTGANTNGGGYTSGGTDYSQQAAAQYALTGVTSAGAGNTVLTASAAADMVGNVGCCVSGTNFTISEFFEVASVSVGVSITFGTSHGAASICTGVGAAGVINIGGAFALGGSLDREVFDSVQAGNTVYIGPGTHSTLIENITPGTPGTGPLPVNVIGYNAARGDSPTGANRPTMACGAYYYGALGYWYTRNVIFTGTGLYLAGAGGNSCFINCKATNSSAIANRYAFYFTSRVAYIGCEGISTKGYAFYYGGTLIGCYAHDSNVGVQLGETIINSIIDTCATGVGTSCHITNSTIYNCTTGISGATGDLDGYVSNIITGCTTGASWTNWTLNFWDYNCWNNTTDVVNVTKGAHDITADPLLGSGLVSGADGATSASGLVFTAVSAPFSGVTTSDCLLIKGAGTGATLGVYIIASVDSTSQLTITTSAGASKTGITYGIVKGTDFTLAAGSPCLDAGMQVDSNVGVTGDYKWNIGVDQDDNAAAGGGGGACFVFVQ